MNSNYLQADVANVLSEIDDILRTYPELAEDEELRRDMLEGSTSLHDVLSRLVTIERDADSMGKAIAERMRDLSSRKARMDKRKEAMRALMLRVMKAGNITKAPLPEATVSVSKGRDSVVIVDADALPDALVRVERVPDKKAILEKLAANENVPGAVLKAGQETLTVRAA